MNEQRLSPWDAVSNLIASWSFSDALWVIITIICVFVFYTIGVRRRTKKEASWQRVLFWIVVTAGWFFGFYIVVLPRIDPSSVTSWLLLGVSSLLVFFTTTRLTKSTKLWELIVSGTVVAVIGFTTIATFGVGEQAIGYALISGLLLGMFAGMVTSTIQSMYNRLHEEVADTEKEESSHGKKKGFRFRKVREI